MKGEIELKILNSAPRVGFAHLSKFPKFTTCDNLKSVIHMLLCKEKPLPFSPSHEVSSTLMHGWQEKEIELGGCKDWSPMGKLIIIISLNLARNSKT